MGVQAVCPELFGPTLTPQLPEDRGLINLSTHLKKAAMGEYG